MRSRVGLAVVLALTLALMVAAPASAITKHYQVDNQHPYVGLVAFYDGVGEFQGRCSGSLIDSRTFITAGHCTDDENQGVWASARIWFQQDAGTRYTDANGEDPVTGYPNECAAGTLGISCAESTDLYNYGFDAFAGFPNTHDVGVVILTQPISQSFYATLASPGTLNKALKRKNRVARFRVSGYGLSYASPVKALSFRERLMADGKLVNTNSKNNAGFNLQTQGNGRGQGGTCSGDSGGPVFYPANSHTIVAVTSFGMNANCRGVDFAYRLDRGEVRDWIAGITG